MKLSLKARSYNLKKLSRFLLRSRNLAIVLSIAVIISLIATYAAITSKDSLFVSNIKSVIGFIVADLILILSLTTLIFRKFIALIVGRRKGVVGSRIQTKIVVMFSIAAIVPTIIMTVFSALFFNLGVESWFDKKISSSIEGSVAVAEGYLEEHRKIIRSDILAMANDINRDAYNIRMNPRTFASKVSILAGIRKLPEAIVFTKINGTTEILARTNLSFALQMILEDMPEKIIEQASKGELVTLTNESDDRVIALIRLDNFFDTYLLVGRFIDTNIINHIEFTKGASNEYTKLKNDRSALQIKFLIVFIIVSLIILLASVWLAFIFTGDLVRPISQLITAAEKVKGGNWSVRVDEGPEDDEMANLGRTFNKMIKQLDRQRKDLISAQRRSAWADVARRIAHEIKNPLTPIQLASERLQKKYMDKVDDPALFNRYVETINRNVKSIGDMVEEFSSFARIPAPKFSETDIGSLISDALFSRDGISNDVIYKYKKPDDAVIINCDYEQIFRVMTNLLKNSEESIEERKNNDGRLKEGWINIELQRDDNGCIIKISDNGKGFAKNIIERLTEPYVTTKSKGTGLGLAIVKKIIEDHNGQLSFKNTSAGAMVTVELPLVVKEENESIKNKAYS